MSGTFKIGDKTVVSHSDITDKTTLTADEANVGSNALVVDSSGKVGIGTSSPSQTLSIRNGVDNQIRLENGGIDTQSYEFGRNGSTGLLTFYGNQTGYTGYVFSGVDGERMRIDSNGNLLIGSPFSTLSNTGGHYISPSYAFLERSGGPALYVNRFTSNGSLVEFRSANSTVGSISTSGTTTTYNTSSDYRLKENITEITDGINRVKQLNPSRFNFIADPDVTVDGFIAHEVADIVPESITGEKDAVNEDGSIDPQGIDQSKLVPLLTAALQESIALIESQQSQIDALTTRIEALETA